ncbi:MAG TPA: hypothetical protein VGK67_00510 [Myxococcales bacterium]|jgi:hypothetical protein
MPRLLWATLLAALALSGCGLLYDWNTLQPSWVGSDAGTGRDAAWPSLDGGFPFAAQPGAPGAERAGRAPARAHRR